MQHKQSEIFQSPAGGSAGSALAIARRARPKNANGVRLFWD